MAKEPKDYQQSGDFKPSDLVIITVGLLKNKLGFVTRRIPREENIYDSPNHYSVLVDNTFRNVYVDAMRLISRVNT